MYAESLKKAAEKSREVNSDPANEYVENGLIYCAKCKTPKQMRLEIGMGEDQEPLVIYPYIPCKCKQAEIDRAERIEADRKRQEHIAHLNGISGIPDLYREATLANWHMTKQNQAIHKMLSRYADKYAEMKRAGKGLLLHGNIGTGKTYAAACVGNAVLSRGESVFWTSTYEMTKLRSDDDEELFTDRILGVSLLIVDDIGAERTSEYSRERVFGYIDGRCSTGRPMILTTNLDFQAMLKPGSESEARIYDRILKRCFPIAFTGESWRKNEARDNFAEMKKILEGND